MNIKNKLLGFIQLPILIILIATGALGTFTVVKGPELVEEYKQGQLQKELAQKSLPQGAATADTILVGFRTGVPTTQRDFIHQKLSIALKKRVNQINADVINVPAGTPVSELIDKYRQNPQVEYAEPNFLAAAFLTPNDPYYGSQWNLQKVLVEEAYDLAKGGGALIAVVDTGVDGSHPDLSGLVIEGYNTIDENNNSFDDHGHGTHVAGIASAQTDNGSGIASMSFASSVLPVKVLNKDGVGTYADVSEGIIYASDNGARIVNLSLGGSSDSETLKRAVRYAQSKGSILVAAAGNSGNDAPVYPAAYEGVLAVSASDKNDNLAPFSSYGSNIFAASPGVSITSSVPGSDYKQASGTSMAAPHVSGLLALSISHKPELSNSELIDQIKQNAEKVGQYSYNEDGWNPYFGYGRISAGKTLTAISSDETTEEEPEPTLDTSSSSRLSKQAKVPQAYSFSFDLQGAVEAVNTFDSKLTLKVGGGTPNVMERLSGNLIDVYINSQTRIKYQGRTISLTQVSSGSQLNIKGNIIQNRLVALEIIVQYLATGQPIEALPNQNQNPGQENIPQSQQQGEQSPQDSGQSSQGGGAPQVQLPPQAGQGKGVKGISVISWLQFIQEKAFGLFNK
ncbi:MAG: peptidase S8 [Candidatus Levybacteria bacterium]|nr:peptidase S8 [Candidatus Levybacteria bacterium]